MRELILIRHAKSDWSNPFLDDFERPLNKRGEKNAPFMAKILKKEIQKPDLIISSPSFRTKLTLEYFLKEFEYKGEVIFEKSIYEAPFENLLKVIKNIDDKYKTIFLIGHNPGLNDLANFLLGSFEDNIATSGVLKIDFDTNSWKNISKDNSKLIFFKYPKMFE
ncbi:SixA phosphatase family protein [Aliarcobacter skirrowii]|uniref:SixA phosphatase family protein n=1 Tax=Aliarcobacter skirrowii TaxID=28200 RepID=UPI000D605678|nr:histidine phosphatase family protein [Aliarcobacter skirrowii]MDX4012560.1 histidine phosphatase family protein [Aliarcobacter skirrowii]MDX4065302.1 histidine phosphatase family protein [Aliarcobacter skirrowii]PWE19922.1 phosphohistidine phosphatase [Aliarcobacter skirrowii]PWE25093.1 phosphohistidine phosphatase [Aliarcobacter skirrowii]RJO55471.1 histidine phosphatase family protein [Aliarcobacter skirrowii]